MAMVLNKVGLSARLGVSERTLTEWQRKGMPVVSQGRRGNSNGYDLASVVQWIRKTGSGLSARHLDMSALEAAIGVPAADAVTRTGHGQHGLAPAILRARINWFADLGNWGFAVSASDMAEIGALLIGAIQFELENGVFAADAQLIESAIREDAYTDDSEATLARMRAELASIQATSNGT